MISCWIHRELVMGSSIKVKRWRQELDVSFTLPHPLGTSEQEISSSVLYSGVFDSQCSWNGRFAARELNRTCSSLQNSLLSPSDSLIIEYSQKEREREIGNSYLLLSLHADRQASLCPYQMLFFYHRLSRMTRLKGSDNLATVRALAEEKRIDPYHYLHLSFHFDDKRRHC